MFTGIITEVGTAKRITRYGKTACLEVKCEKIRDALEPGDSVSVNGVCLSVVKKDITVAFDVVKNTMRSTNLKRLRPGQPVNLECALRLGDDLSGHMVSGHVDGERCVRANRSTARGWALEIAMLPGDRKHFFPKGSVSVDGISLTVAELLDNAFRVFVIPHTLDNTTLKYRKAGDFVNVEFDIMLKYAEKHSMRPSSFEKLLEEEGFV